MKKYFKKLFAFVLCLTLCISNFMPVQAANENNTRGITFDVTLDTPTITTSTEDQTVVMRLNASKEVTVDGIGLTVTKDEPLTIASIVGGDKIGEFPAASTNLETGVAGWQSEDSENVDGVTELVVVTFTVPANTAAGTYNVGFEDLELTQDYGGEIWENAANASTTLTITDNSVTTGYTAGLTTLTSEVSVEDSVTINLGVSHSDDTAFAAGEMVVSYDNAKLAFNENASTLGTATAKDNAGTLTLEDYGTDKNFGTGVYVLVFDAIADGEATVALTSAAFVNKENAVKSDLISATLSSVTVNVTINKKTYSITLPEIFEGQTSVIDGEDYTFSVTDGENYDYDAVSATMDGVTVEVVDNGDGTYTIKNVTGALVITGTRTEKNYTVTLEGNAAEDITDAADQATYNADYTFTIPTVEGWAYSLDSIKINGSAYTGYSVENGVYTIPGSAITGDIVIIVSKSATEASVTVEGAGAGVAAGYITKVEIGESFILTIVPEAGYTYTVTATMGGESVEITDNGDNTYTIAEVTDNVVFYITRTVIVDGVTVAEYVALDGSVMWLVKNATTLADGKVPTYNGENMFWSEEYGTYCYLVIAETLSTEDAAAMVGITDGEAVTVDYGMDVNKTGKVDASDAQLTYNIYNALYSAFDANATMEKFLRADVNTDGKVNVEDATAIITEILK